MSVRFDASGDRLVRTSGVLNYNQPYTVMGWFYVEDYLTQYNTLIALNRNDYDGDQDWIYLSSTGNIWCYSVVGTGSASEIAGGAMGLDTWFHLALVRESATSLKVYVNGVLIDTGTINVSARAAATRLEIGGLTNGASQDQLNGRAAYLKAWSAGLSLAEVQAEVHTIRPMRTADLYGFWPCFPGASERAVDYSGNGNNWSVTGTLADNDPPPVSWGGLLPFALGIPAPVRPADAGTAVLGPSVSMGGPVSASPAAASAAAASADLAALLGSVSITPDPRNARARREGPVSDTTTLVSPAPCAARAGRADPALDLGSVSITPAPGAAAASSVDPSCVVAFLIRPEPCTAVADVVTPELFFSSCSLVPAFAYTLTSAPPLVYRVLNVTVIDMTVSARPQDLTIGERRGVHLIERWELEDGTGHWLFEDGSGIVLGMGLEGAKLNLWARSLEITVDEKADF